LITSNTVPKVGDVILLNGKICKVSNYDGEHFYMSNDVVLPADTICEVIEVVETE
jgi:hypothetical protein